MDCRFGGAKNKLDAAMSTPCIGQGTTWPKQECVQRDLSLPVSSPERVTDDEVFEEEDSEALDRAMGLWLWLWLWLWLLLLLLFFSYGQITQKHQITMKFNYRLIHTLEMKHLNKYI